MHWMSSSTVINEILMKLDKSWNHLRGDDTLAVAVNVGAFDVFVNSYK